MAQFQTLTVVVERPGLAPLQKKFSAPVACNAVVQQLQQQFGAGELSPFGIEVVLLSSIELQPGSSYVYRVFPGAAPVSPVQLSKQVILTALLQEFGQPFDKAAGQRLMQQLLDRGDGVPIQLQTTARQLGSQCPLFGYRSVVRALASELVSMEVNRQQLHSDPDSYKRTQHILQLAGPPGLGKTTAATAMWAALHFACNRSCVDDLLPEASEGWDRMRQRIQLSMSPTKLLVFGLNFAQSDLGKLHPLEQESSSWHNILALRLLYGVLSPQHRISSSYPTFLVSLPQQLRRSLLAHHVAAFVRQQSGFGPSDQLLMVWVFDEAQSFEPPLQPAKSVPAIANLLSAFVEFRVQCTSCSSATLPVCLTASTLWSRTLMMGTASAQAKIADLQLLPLNDIQCKHVFVSVCRRIQQQKQQRPGDQQAQHLLQCADLAVPQQLQEQRAATQWPPFFLQPSASLSLHDMQLPDTTEALLQLAGGIPRLVSFGLSAMANVPADYVLFADRVLPWWLSEPPSDFNAAKMLLVDSARKDARWQFFNKKDTKQLLDMAFACNMLQEPVDRTQVVGIPGCSSSDISCTIGGTEGPYTWERGEQDGLWLLMTADGRRQWLSDPGGAADKGAVDERSEYFVQAIPLLMAAFPPSSVTPLAASSLPVLQANVAWRHREQQDVGVLAVRCLIASQVFQRRTITLQRLLKCREPSARGSGGLLGVEVWLPEHHMPVREIREQLDASAFRTLVVECLNHPEQQPFAYTGPGNKGADGWLVFQQVSYDATGAASRGEPFIIFTSSKQRRKPESVKGADIVQEKEKDVITTDFRFVYVFITDQAVVNAPDNDDIVVVGPQEHEAFYGCCSQLLRLSKV